MSPKQKIYQEILRIVLPNARNQQSLPWWKRGRSSDCFYELELVHNLHVSLFEEDFSDHDVWFLNTQAKWYREKAIGSGNYEVLCNLLTDLRSLVPSPLQSQLN